MKKSLFKALVLAILCSMTLGFASVQAAEVDPAVTGSTVTTATMKEGLKEENGSYYYYVHNVAQKSTWKTIGKSRYYFLKSGKAATGLTKIGSKHYLFSKSGRLVTATNNTKVATVFGKKYLVTTSGTVKKNAWDSTKTYYFGKKYVPVTGKQVIKDKFYAFSRTGKKLVDTTKKLQAACKYNKSPIANLKKLIGNPTKTRYTTGCFGSGKDGRLSYQYFWVYTYKEGSKEVYMGCEARAAAPTYIAY